MADLFTLKLILSFIVGGGYAIIATVSADKLGTKIGGLVAGLPNTVLFGLLFIAWTQDTHAAVEATTLLPATIGIACYFLIAYVFFIRFSLWKALSVAYVIWGALAFFLVKTNLTNFFICIIFFCFSFMIAYMYLIKVVKLASAKGRSVAYTTRILLLRGLLSGLVIAFSVFIAKTGGPIIGGIFTTFPAMITSVLIINYHSHGQAFSLGVAKSTLFGWIGSVIFVAGMRYTIVPLGIIPGSLISLVASYVSAYLLYNYVLKKHS